MANSADPDQLASEKPTDLDLHCLQRQDISGFSRTRVKNSIVCVLMLSAPLVLIFYISTNWPYALLLTLRKLGKIFSR